MNVYFVIAGLRSELDVIKKIRPRRVLCSYWYFKTRKLEDLCEDIGYRPEIMLDSGAYSAFTRGKNQSLLDYMAYIRENEQFIDRYIAMDVIGDSYTTKAFYDIMRAKGFDPIPVYHYGDDVAVMDYYVASGADVIALGNTVPIRDKGTVAEWCVEMHRRHPGIDLHLLGSSSKKMLECGALASCDSSAWYMLAVNGKPKVIPGLARPSKADRAEANMVKVMEDFNDYPVPIINRRGERADGEVQPDHVV